jgi:hypothetical protein
MEFQTLISIFNDWQNVILTGGVLVAIFVAGWTVLNDRKNLKLNGLNLTFQKFNDPESRKARRNILSAYHDYLINNDFPTEYTYDNFLDLHPPIDIIEEFPKLLGDAESVKSDFEQVAVMEKNGLLDKKAYFDAFYGSMLRCYGALDGHIETSRMKTGSKHYTTYFQKQCKEAVKYWEKNHKSSTLKYHGQERDDFTLQRFKENDVWKVRILHPQSNIQNCIVFCEKEPLRSTKHENIYEHTIEIGGGDNFEMPENLDNNNPMIIIKSGKSIIKRIPYFDIEIVQH